MSEALLMGFDLSTINEGVPPPTLYQVEAPESLRSPQSDAEYAAYLEQRNEVLGSLAMTQAFLQSYEVTGQAQEELQYEMLDLQACLGILDNLWAAGLFGQSGLRAEEAPVILQEAETEEVAAAVIPKKKAPKSNKRRQKEVVEEYIPLPIYTGPDTTDDVDEELLSWQERALCAQTDPEVFFPEKGGSTREAKRVCLGCEVKDECLVYALDNDERFGIWGGLSERERRRLKRKAH